MPPAVSVFCAVATDTMFIKNVDPIENNSIYLVSKKYTVFHSTVTVSSFLGIQRNPLSTSRVSHLFRKQCIQNKYIRAVVFLVCIEF